MVEHEAHFGASGDHPDDIRQMMVKHADVEGEVIGSQKFQPGDEIGPDAEIGIGLGLDQPSHRAKDLVPAKPIEFGFDGVAALERECSDHAFELGLRPGKVGDPGPFVEVLRKIDIDFNEHELIDFNRRSGREQMLRQHLAFERRCPLRPPITEAVRVAQVNV